MLLEAERRGILPPDKSAMLVEARRRGLVPATAAAVPAPGVTNPTGASRAAQQGYGRGGRAPSNETLAAMRDNGLTRTVEGAIADPIGTLNAIPAGLNRGVVAIPGLVADTGANVIDLLGMGYGASRSLISGRPANEFYETYDRAQVVGSGEYLANKLDQGLGSVGAGAATRNPSPNNPAARILYAGASGIPGAVTGRMALAGGAGGASSQIVAEAGGGPAAQAAAGLLGGRVAERVPASPQRPVTPPPSSSFGPDSASAAAATPQLAKVPADLRGPIIEATMRGDREMVSRVIEAETLPIPIKLLEGQARQDPRLISDEHNLRAIEGSGIPERMQEQNQALIDNLDEIRREVSPNVVASDHIQNGQALIDSYKAYDAPIREAITAKYKALEDANGGQLPINAKSFVDAADKALGKKLKTRYLPNAIAGDLAEFREAGGMMTFEQFENLRTNLATEARKADRAGDGNASAAINVVRRELENMPMDGVSAELKAMADDARASARARFEALDNDPAYRAAVDDDTPSGELSAFADEFVKKYVVNGKLANLTRMREKLGADPTASETLAAAALNYVKSKSGVNLYTNEGNFSQAGFNRALAEITPRLGAMVPNNVAEMLQQLGNVARHVQMRPKGAFVNESNTFTAAAGEVAKGYGEGALNTVVPGAQLGTFIRKSRQKGRDKDRASRALDPRKYLTKAPD